MFEQKMRKLKFSLEQGLKRIYQNTKSSTRAWQHLDGANRCASASYSLIGNIFSLLNQGSSILWLCSLQNIIGKRWFLKAYCIDKQLGCWEDGFNWTIAEIVQLRLYLNSMCSSYYCVCMEGNTIYDVYIEETRSRLKTVTCRL